MKALNYFGSKYKTIPYYPEPIHNTIIEPFAGSAAYSYNYYEHDIILVEKDLRLFTVFKYLQTCSEKDLDNLPRLKYSESIKNFNLSQEEFFFLSYLVHPSANGIRFSCTKWGEARLDKNINYFKEVLPKIKHWKIIYGDYKIIENIKATWFIDPPYKNKTFKAYTQNDINYEQLSKWVLERKGQVIACEGENGDWLPFKHLTAIPGKIGKVHIEKIYLQNKD